MAEFDEFEWGDNFNGIDWYEGSVIYYPTLSQDEGEEAEFEKEDFLEDT